MQALMAFGTLKAVIVSLWIGLRAPYKLQGELVLESAQANAHGCFMLKLILKRGSFPPNGFSYNGAYFYSMGFVDG